MMHTECMEWLKRVLPKETEARPLWVLELGSRDVNGSPRELYPLAVAARRYVGVDIAEGPGADIVADAATFRPGELSCLPPLVWRTSDGFERFLGGASMDVVICVEVLEHAERWQEIVDTAAYHVKPGGLVAITAAGPARAEHSAVDGLELRPGEHYGNIRREALEERLRGAGLRAVVVTYDRGEQDVRAVARGR